MQRRASRRTARTTALLLLSAFVVVRLLFWILPDIFEPWNARTIDRLFELRSQWNATRPLYDSTVVHIDISDRTINALQQSYLNRRQYAKVVENLRAMNVAVQGWDFIFLARTNDEEDRAFIDASARAGNVVYGLAFDVLPNGGQSSQPTVDSAAAAVLRAAAWHPRVEGTSQTMLAVGKVQMTFADLARSASGLGFLNVLPDRDGVFRRVPLLIRRGSVWYPSFSLLLVCRFLNVPHERVVLIPGERIVLTDAKLPDGRHQNISIPIDARGMMVVNYIGPWERMKHYDFADVLYASDDQMEMDLWREELAGKIVIISQVTTGSSDIGPAPTDVNLPLSNLHANAVHTILTQNFLREAGESLQLLFESVLLVLLLGVSYRFPSKHVAAGAVLLVVLEVALGAALFLFGKVVLNVVRPAVTLAMGTLTVLAYRFMQEEKQKEVLRRSFEAYFPPTIVQKLLLQPDLVTTGAQKKELTILFSDIKSFTTYSSTLQPDEIHRLLNQYFEAMVEVVFRWGGTVDKFIGDGLMVFFGDPEPQPDHALRCVQAAVQMQKKCRELKANWEAAGYFPLRVRIGIHTGEVVVGNMGSSRRLSYTALGSDVNLAQRLESNAPVEGILISRRTYELVKEHVPTKPHDPIHAKGLAQPIEVYEVPVE